MLVNDRNHQVCLAQVVRSGEREGVCTRRLLLWDSFWIVRLLTNPLARLDAPRGAWRNWPRSFPQIEKKKNDSKRTANGGRRATFRDFWPQRPRRRVAREQGRPTLVPASSLGRSYPARFPVVSPSTSPRLPWYRNRTARPALFEKKKGRDRFGRNDRKRRTYGPPSSGAGKDARKKERGKQRKLGNLNR